MDVLLPMKVALILSPVGGMWQMLRAHGARQRSRLCAAHGWAAPAARPGLDVVRDPLNKVAAVLVLHGQHLVVHLRAARPSCQCRRPAALRIQQACGSLPGPTGTAGGMASPTSLAGLDPGRACLLAGHLAPEDGGGGQVAPMPGVCRTHHVLGVPAPHLLRLSAGRSRA